jgi:hypothetical protein
MVDTTRLNEFFWGAVNPSAGVTSWFAPSGTPAPTPPNIITVALPIGRVGVAYPATTFLVDGTGPFTWALSPSTPTLPAGMAFSAAGVLSGTPTEVWSQNMGFRVTGAAGVDLRDTQVMALTILAADVVTPPVTPPTPPTDPNPGTPPDGTPPPVGQLPGTPDPISGWVRLPRDTEVWIRVPRDES